MVCSVSASHIDSNTNKSAKRNYEQMTMSPKTQFRAFVRVPLHLKFIFALDKPYHLKKKPPELLCEDIQFWCPWGSDNAREVLNLHES